MFRVPYKCNVSMTVDTPSLSRSSDRFGVPCCGYHFLDHGYVPKQPCPSSRKFDADSLFSEDGKGFRVISCGELVLTLLKQQYLISLANV